MSGSGVSPRVVCIGAATIDCRAVSFAPVVAGSSNPVDRRFGFGGVARNVAEGLARLGVPVALVSRVGKDAAGTRLAADLGGLGVDLSGLGRSSERPTAEYAALLEPGGEMFVAFADMAIFDELDVDRVVPAVDAFAGARLWFADANLREDTLAALGASKPGGVRLAVDAVSVAKSERLRGVLPRVDLLFANRLEAAALAGIAGDGHDTACRAAAALVEAGAGAVVVAAGADGAILADAGGVTSLPALPAAVVDVTGAGDSLAAGTLYGIDAGRSLGDAVRLGLAAAAYAVESLRPVSTDITAARIAERACLERGDAP